MAQRPEPDADRPTDPRVLLDLLRAFDEPTIVGFEPTRHHLEVHTRPLRFDPRAIGAGLFGVRAGSAWSGAGVVFTGRLRRLDDPAAEPVDATGRVVLDRRGRLASALEGDERVGASDPVSGVVVDGLHRVLGLPAPGDAPHPARVALALWSTDVVAATLERGPLSWSEVVALHPGDPGPGLVAPSTETVVEATLRCASRFDWARVHRRACRGEGALPGDLRPSEAAWMDPVMYARWVTDALVDPVLASGVLGSRGAEDTAARLVTVAAAVTAEVRNGG